MITEKEKELYEAKIRRFYRTLDKIVKEHRKNFVLPTDPSNSRELDALREISREVPNEETLESIVEILNSKETKDKD